MATIGGGGYDVELVLHIDELNEKVKEALIDGLDAVGRDAASTAAQFAPYKTGALRNSITNAVDSEELAAYIGTNLNYAVYQEFGTSRIAGKHFIKAGATLHASDYERWLQKRLDGIGN